ncbi:hypothetical protein B0H19DRAFT_15818 [Mycena capillaripes]|nr:hypothetical protein B0H19DRAFT_15818 [Mycena capillaripes]
MSCCMPTTRRIGPAQTTSSTFLPGGHSPALHELELRLAECDLVRVLKVGFYDVVLHTLTGSVPDGHGESAVELLADALLCGVDPLVVFGLGMEQVDLSDDAGRIRRLQCWNEDSAFEVQKVWKILSIQYDLHKSVREIRIRPEYWNEYLEIFESYPPQLQDGITFVIETEWLWSDGFPQPTDDEDSAATTKIMRIPGLEKVEFCDSRHPDSSLELETILDVIARIEPTHKVDICIGKNTVTTMGDTAQGSFLALKAALPGKCWAICNHCVH